MRSHAERGNDQSTARARPAPTGDVPCTKHFGETFNQPVQTDHALLGIVPPLFALRPSVTRPGYTRETA